MTMATLKIVFWALAFVFFVVCGKGRRFIFATDLI